jgi:formyltetrahydrofolate deformylase
MIADYILTLSCDDVRGIVASVASFIAEKEGFIYESTQFGDASTGKFFLRMAFEAGKKTPSQDQLKKEFHEKVGAPFNMDWNLYDRNRKRRVVIMVSKQGHCLNDLLFRSMTGQLDIEIPAVISNHQDMEEMMGWHKIPFYHLPVNGDKPAQEAKVMEVVERHEVDVVVLARYMQILSPDLSAKLHGKAINIHHSFLPSFKGAKPYHQAYDRGVKIIGATAHYVTDDLDEGPIIEQEVVRVDHSHDPKKLVAMGQDIECTVLARALTYHIEHRVLLNGSKTVVFK